MQVVKVVDVNNTSYSYLVKEVKDNDIVIAPNINSLQRLYTTFIRHNKRIVTAYTFRGFLEKILGRKIDYGYKSLKRILALNFLTKCESNTQRARAIDHMCMLYKCQKVLQETDDEKYFKAFNKERIIKLEDYIKFKELHDKHGVYTIEDAMLDALAVGVKRSYDTVYILNYEDYANLNYKVLEHTIDAKKLVLIGDEYKATNYTATSMPYPTFSTLTVSDSFYTSEKVVEAYAQIKEKLNTPYKAVHNGKTGFYVERDFSELSLTKVKSELFKHDSAVIVYEHFLLSYQVESLLFQENIPFYSFLDEYKFPKFLYKISDTMIKLISREGYVTLDEVKSIVKHLHPNLLAKFGGRKKVMSRYTAFMYPASAISKDKLISYLKKCWLDRNFGAVLEPESAYQYQMWKYRFKQEWLSPKVRTGLITNLKCCNVDVVVYVYSSDTPNPKDIYTAMTMCNAGVYVLKIKSKSNGGKA